MPRMIYLDQHAEPKDIARTLWRELGPQLCILIATALVNRDGLPAIIDLTDWRKQMKPEKQNPAPLAGGNRAKETFNSGEPELRPSVYKLQVWSDRLERRIQCLAAMADWRDELQSQNPPRRAPI